MGVLAVRGMNDINGYILLFNISGRPKYCFSIEKHIVSTEEVLL